jgi:hypothetical protein
LKIPKELECAFDFVGKILMNRINGIYLVRFEFQMGNIDLK